MYDERDWWRHGIVYQVYPRSFADASGDGVGDLAGITGRLDHLQWLGVDAIWLSPIFRSPMADFGYDVSDHCDVDPLFGTLADLDRLVEEAHRRDIRLLLDFVPNHTSDRHPWFVESRSSREGPRRDWYWWRDPSPGGGPPNNWVSNFGGPAWTLDPKTDQYYLHLFLPEQPDLNWANPEVVEAMHGVLRFWLERGVDGFRIDVAHAMAKDAQLRDNPVHPEAARLAARFGRPNEPLGQIHLYDQNQPEVHDIIKGFRDVLDQYSADGRTRMAVGEVYLLDTAEMVRYYGTGDDALHLAFNFPFLWSPWSASTFRQRVEEFEALLPPAGWPTYTLSNHDHPRHLSRFGPERARAAAMMVLGLRGTPFLYYGEEIGMPDVDDAAGHDPMGRDPERTPIRWDGSSTGGFTSGEPWLPLCGAEVNVAAQREDPTSLLSFYRRMIALRRSTPALHAGDYATRPSPQDVFAWRRGGEVEVAINMGDRPATVDLQGTVAVATQAEREGERLEGGTVLQPDEGLVVLLGD